MCWLRSDDTEVHEHDDKNKVTNDYRPFLSLSLLLSLPLCVCMCVCIYSSQDLFALVLVSHFSPPSMTTKFEFKSDSLKIKPLSVVRVA